MIAKEYLSQARNIDNEIQSMLEEVSVLRSMAEKTTAVITGMPSNATRNTSQLSDTIAKIIEREEKIDAEIDRLVDLRSEIYETIQQVEDKEARRVLYLRYMGYRSWAEIATEMKLDLRQIYRLHGVGLKNISPMSLNVTKWQSMSS